MALREVFKNSILHAFRDLHVGEQSIGEPDIISVCIAQFIFDSLDYVDFENQTLESAINKLVVDAMQDYFIAYRDQPWFWQLDLVPVFSKAVSESLRPYGCEWKCMTTRTSRLLRVEPRYVEKLVRQYFMENKDRWVLEKAVWHSAQSNFDSVGIAGKICKSLHGSYDEALKQSLKGSYDPALNDDFERVKAFMKIWMRKAMDGAWTDLENDSENPEKTLTPEKVARLFGHLTRPFGNEHSYTCIPNIWFSHKAPPFRNWSYIPECVRDFFTSKRVPNADVVRPAGFALVAPDTDSDSESNPAWPATTKKRPPSESPVSTPRRKTKAKVEVLQKPHPSCNLAEDCQGTEADKLIIHVHDCMHGDQYCVTCWKSFLQKEPRLVGLHKDDYTSYS